MIDVTPQDLDEVEKYVFRTHRVSGKQLEPDLRWAIEDIVDNICDPFYSDLRKFEVDKQNVHAVFVDFNCNKIHKYTHGILATATAGFRLWLYNGQVQSEIWVDYNGITQAEADRLPPQIRNALYSRYLQSYNRIRSRIESSEDQAKQIIEVSIKKALAKYIGQKNTPQTMAAVQQELERAILNTGLVDGIDISRDPNNGCVITSKIVRTSQPTIILQTVIS